MFTAMISLARDRVLDQVHVATLGSALPDNYRPVNLSVSPAQVLCYGIDPAECGEQLQVFTRGDQEVTVLLGEWILSGDSAAAGEHTMLGRHFGADSPDLQRVRGVFGLVHIRFDHDDVKVTLCSDKLGIRPLYYWSDGSLMIVSTRLEVVERLPFIRKYADKRGIAETIAFGYPLSDRTQYLDVYRIGAAEIVSLTRGEVRKTRYWRWDAVGYSSLGNAEYTSEAHRLFLESIKVRQREDDAALAFLSGGMDSRVIVGALVAGDRQVTTLNFSPEHSQDQELAARIATVLQCRHLQMPLGEVDPGTFRPDLARLYADLIDQGRVPSKSRQIWSGDGGSVGLGTCHLDDAITETMRRGQVPEATRKFRLENSIGLPLRSMSSTERRWHGDHLRECIAEELSRLEHDDPAQKLFIFLMLNDQRRHLDDFYEDQHVHRLSYHLPFYDSELLHWIFRIPLDYRLCHRFYSDWFGLFDARLRSVPWQTYPGHVPCPLPVEASLSYQWDTAKQTQDAGEWLQVASRGVRQALGVHGVRPLSRLRLLACALLHVAGRGDYRHVFDACDKFRRFASISTG